MNKKGDIETITYGIFIVIIVSFLLFMIVYKLLYAFTTGNESIVIDDKWEKVKGDNAKYLVSSLNGQVFEISDSLFKWRWDSSNLYATIKPGQVCQIETQGWRFGFLSDYKNIMTAECMS